MSEETKIEQKLNKKMRKPQVFNLIFPKFRLHNGRISVFWTLLPFFVRLRLNDADPNIDNFTEIWYNVRVKVPTGSNVKVKLI